MWLLLLSKAVVTSTTWMASCKGPIAYSLFILLANKKFDYFGQYSKHTFQLKAGRSEHFTQHERKTSNYLAQSIKLIKLNRCHVHLKKALSKKRIFSDWVCAGALLWFWGKDTIRKFWQANFFSRKHFAKRLRHWVWCVSLEHELIHNNSRTGTGFDCRIITPII